MAGRESAALSQESEAPGGDEPAGRLGVTSSLVVGQAVLRLLVGRVAILGLVPVVLDLGLAAFRGAAGALVPIDHDPDAPLARDVLGSGPDPAAEGRGIGVVVDLLLDDRALEVGRVVAIDLGVTPDQVA